MQTGNHRDTPFVRAIVRERDQIIILDDSKLENRYFITIEYIIFFHHILNDILLNNKIIMNSPDQNIDLTQLEMKIDYFPQKYIFLKNINSSVHC